MTKLRSKLLMAIGLAVAAPAWAVSLPAAGPTSTSPETPDSASPAPADSWTAGSFSLVPLMAADMQANQIATVDAPELGAGAETGKPLDDISFVQKATESGRKDLAAARDALSRLQQPELKSIAEMLVNDHGGANVRLIEIADSKGWPVPGAVPLLPPEASGAATGDFDARWTADMIAGHEHVVALYRAQALNGEDKDLRKYARDTLPTIERHLADLRRLQK